MTKKIIYILIPACMTLPIAVAEPLPSNPVLLSLAQMDQVTAGLGAAVNVDAVGISSFFANTRTKAVATTAVTNNDHPALGGYVEVAGGGAVAVAAGQGASTSTTVIPATSQAGQPGSYTNQASGHFKGSLVEINASMIYTSGGLFVNPL